MGLQALGGGNIASFVQTSYQYGILNVGSINDRFSGWGDTYIEPISWSKRIGPLFGESIPANSRLPYGLTVKASYAMILPTGTYNSTDLFTPGHNDYFYIPNFAATYLTAPNLLGDGLEFSLHYFCDISSKNPATNYQSGTVGDLDFAVSERTGPWQYGFQGYYARQYTNDYQNGLLVAPNGKKLISLSLGPVVAYDLPNGIGTIKAKVQIPATEENSLNITRFVMSFVVPLGGQQSSQPTLLTQRY